MGYEKRTTSLELEICGSRNIEISLKPSSSPQDPQKNMRTVLNLATSSVQANNGSSRLTPAIRFDIKKLEERNGIGELEKWQTLNALM